MYRSISRAIPPSKLTHLHVSVIDGKVYLKS